MSRTHKDKPGRKRRLVKNSLYKKYVHVLGEDFKHKKKDKTITRVLRRKLKKEKATRIGE